MSAAGLTVRPYRDADLEALVRVYTRAVHVLGAACYDAAQRNAWAPRVPDLGEWRRRLAALTTVVGEAEGGLAGFLSYRDDGHIALLYVSPAHARRGVASVLYRHAESALAAAGLGELSTEASLVARPFFAGRGFRVVEEQSVLRAGVALRRYAMRKMLDHGGPAGGGQGSKG